MSKAQRAARYFAAVALTSVLMVFAGCGGGAQTSSTTFTAEVTASADPVVGEPLVLDASTSVVPNVGGTLSYNWTAATPTGQPIAMFDTHTARPYFMPTTAGTYSVTLSLTLSAPPNSATSTTRELSVAVSVFAPPAAAVVRERIRTLAAAAVAPLPPDSSSPTLSVSEAGAASAIPGSRLVDWSRPEFVYNGDLRTAGSVYPDYLFGANRAVSYSNSVRSSNYVTVDFVTDAQQFEVFQKGLGFNSRMRVMVDGRLANATPLQLPLDGALYLTRVRFETKASRRIRLMIDNPYFGGVRVAASDSVTRPATGTRLRTMFLGDSVTEGTAGQNAASSYAPRTAELLGWNEAWISGVGSTGYLAAPSPKLTLRQRYAADVKAYLPAVLVIAAGINDTTSSDSAIQQEATLLFNQIQADLPDTAVFVAGPWGLSDRVRPGISAAIKAAVGTRANFYWVPNAEEPWITGNGNVAQPNGSGNADLYISSDRTHPTPAGIEYIAGKLAAFIKQAVP